MRLSINHTTGFHYSSTVRSSYNEARLTPQSSARQSVWSSRVSIEPTPWSYSYTDYWGSQVTAFEVHDPHRVLTVQGFSLVETRTGDDWAGQPSMVAGDGSDPGVAPSPESRAAVAARFAEYLTDHDRTRPPSELATAAADLAGGHDPRTAVVQVCRLIADRVTYVPGSTEVATLAAEAWEGGSGVCQDFSHLTLGALRSVGIPARYVSGYLHPLGTRAEVGSVVDGESHAWIEFWAGQWLAYDPTSGRVPGEGHVRLGHGRDYRDVAPLRGTYAGGESEMFVTVRLTRLG